MHRLFPPRLRSICMMSFALLVFAAGFLSSASQVSAEELRAGVAKVEITNREAGPVHDPLFVKALVLQAGSESFLILTVDAVAIGEIGAIPNEYLPNVRKRVEAATGIRAHQIMINASHCHGVVCSDIEDRTVQAVQQATETLVPVKVGVGSGSENRIMENRRLKLTSGQTIDVRHAYSLPPDEEIAEVGPVDPEIGILRLDRLDGTTLAVVYNFACHPIQGVPGGANTADLTGIASTVIEENLDEGTVALFVQGCGGDINPIDYKDVDHPRSAVPLGHKLGLSTLKAVRKIECQQDSRLEVLHETLSLPRGDRTHRIAQLEQQRDELLRKLRGTSLNLKTFMPLVVKHKLAEQYPSYYSHRYLHDEKIGREDRQALDAENRRNIEAYINNIHIMEELTRLQTNLALLRKHQASLVASGKRTVDVEITAARIGDFVLLTFPGELTVPIGLKLKAESPCEATFIAGYTNGYIYYAPTAEQLLNAGGAQEDSDCILDLEWEGIFETKALEMLSQLAE